MFTCYAFIFFGEVVCSNLSLLFKQGDLCLLTIEFSEFSSLFFVIHSGPAPSLFPLLPCICVTLSTEHMECSISPTSHSQLREIGRGGSPTVTSIYLAASLGAMTESERAQPGWAQTPLDDHGSPTELCTHLIRSCARGSPLPHPRTDSATTLQQHNQRL